MVVRKNSRKKSFRKNRKKSKKRSLKKNRKKSKKRGGGKSSFWDWLPPVDTLSVRRICQKILDKGQSNSGIFVPYNDPVEYIQDFSFAYQEWQNDKGFGQAVGKTSMAQKKKSRENFIKAIGVIGSTIGGMYMLSTLIFGKSKKKRKKMGEDGWFEESDKEMNKSFKKVAMTTYGSFFALITMGALAGSSEEKKQYQEVLDVVADEWNKKYPNKITGKQIAKIITDNPKGKMDMKKIKILNKMNSKDRDLIAQQQSWDLHQQAHNNAMMMHNQANNNAMMMHNQAMMHNPAMM